MEHDPARAEEIRDRKFTNHNGKWIDSMGESGAMHDMVHYGDEEDDVSCGAVDASALISHAWQDYMQHEVDGDGEYDDGDDHGQCGHGQGFGAAYHALAQANAPPQRRFHE